jgi:hypothetical protein
MALLRIWRQAEDGLEQVVGMEMDGENSALLLLPA